MAKTRIRTLAVCVLRDADRILLEHGYDRVTKVAFYRAIGGGLDFGERAEEAARREWMEELGVELSDLRLLGVIENIFVYEARQRHEIVFVFTGRVPEAVRHATEPLEVVEGDGERHPATWLSLKELEAGAVPVYPVGLLALVRRETGG
jgi:8-oxo-dGTP pyrophosphatase MutT (NUDIX family)